VCRLVSCEAAFHPDYDRREDCGKLVGLLLEVPFNHGMSIRKLA